MLLQISSKLGVLAWFKINQKQIVELFCINKNKPAMECDGKCYLKEKLEEVDNPEHNQNKQTNNTTKNIKYHSVSKRLFTISVGASFCYHI